MRVEFLENGNFIRRAKALTMVGILGLGASACTSFNPGVGGKVEDCSHSHPTDIAVTLDPSAPNYSPDTDPTQLLKFQKLAHIHNRDDTSEDIHNQDWVDKPGEVYCNLPDGSQVLTTNGLELSRDCDHDQGPPAYIGQPVVNIC
jgi:hypothetical protein